MKPLLVQAVARQELRDSSDWYREKNPQVADRFVNEVHRTLERIETSPAAGSRIPYVSGRARRLRVAGFPFYVIFEELPDRIEVLAIAHIRSAQPNATRRSECLDQKTLNGHAIFVYVALV